MKRLLNGIRAVNFYVNQLNVFCRTYSFPDLIDTRILQKINIEPGGDEMIITGLRQNEINCPVLRSPKRELSETSEERAEASQSHAESRADIFDLAREIYSRARRRQIVRRSSQIV